MKRIAIVLSGGSGRRVGGAVPKQYMPLGDYPVIYYSLKAFEDSDVDAVVLVAAKDDIDMCRKEIVERFHLHKVMAIVAGGAERYDSVYNGLIAAKENCSKTEENYVFIHDGARPVLSVELIERLSWAVEREKACVAAVPAKDTIKVADQDCYVAETPDRAALWCVQTPQVFEFSLAEQAYRKAKDFNFCGGITDDAMIVETYGGRKVKLVMGEYTNIKITTPEDFQIAKIFLQI